MMTNEIGSLFLFLFKQDVPWGTSTDARLASHVHTQTIA